MPLPALIIILGCGKNNSSTANESIAEPLPPLMPEMEFSGTEATAISGGTGYCFGILRFFAGWSAQFCLGHEIIPQRSGH